MTNPLKLMGKHSLVYGLGSALTAAGSFVLIPLYTHTLSTEEYGALELLNRIADVFILFMFMGCRQAFTRFYLDKKSEEWRKAVTGTMLAFSLLSSILILLVIYPFQGLLIDTFLQGTVSDAVFFLLLAWIPLEMLFTIGMAYQQINLRSGSYLMISFFRLFAFIGLNFLLIYVFDYGITGVLISQLVVTASIALVMLVFFVKWTRLKISLSILSEMVKFGLPYLPATFLYYIATNASRYFLGYQASLDELGVFSLAYKLGLFGTMLIMDPFLKVWSPFLYEHYKEPDGPKLIGQVLTLSTALVAGAGLSLSVLAPFVLPYLSSPEFHSAYIYVPFICLGTVFYSMHHITDAGMLIAKVTKYKPVIATVGACIGVGGSFLLIPKYGAMGAAIIAVIIPLVGLLFSHFISRRYYVFPIEMRKLLLIFAACISTYLSSTVLVNNAEALIFPELLAVVSLALYPLILWIGGFFSDHDQAVISGLFVRKPRADVR